MICDGCGVVISVSGSGTVVCPACKLRMEAPKSPDWFEVAQAEAGGGVEYTAEYQRISPVGWYLMDGDARVRKITKAEAMEIRANAITS